MTDLKDLDEEFAGAKAPDREPPDGRYIVVSRRAKLDRTRAGDPILKWPLEIESGDQKGKLLFKNIVIKSGKALAWFKSNFEIAGLGDVKPSEVSANLSRTAGIRMSVNKKTKRDGNYVVYFNDRLGES